MDNQDFFVQAFVYLLAALISVPIAKRLGLGSVLGYLLAGIIIGPYVLGFIGTEDNDIMHFAEFGVVMMLFLIGLELRPSILWKMRQSIFGLGGLQVLITALVIGGIALTGDLGWKTALAIGFILALSSTAIVLQSLNEKGILKSSGGQSVFSILLFQDISVIPILAILPLLAVGTVTGAQAHAEEGLVSHLSGWQQLLMIVLIVGAIILLGRFAARYIFRAIASTGLREIFTVTALFIVVAITLAMSSVGLSPALGTFLAGVVLADNEYRHELESDIEPFKGLLLGLFFIAVGASINFRLLGNEPLFILGLLAALIFTKAIILHILARLFKLPGSSSWLLTFALAQGGEFAFVLLSFSLQNSILDPHTTELITIVVALSMAITPLLLLFNEHVVQRILIRKQKDGEEDTIDEKDNPILIAGFGRFGVVVGRLLMANGFRRITILDNDPSHIDSLRKYGFKVYYGDASRPDLLETAGISDAKVLIICLDDYEKASQMVEYARRKNPDLKISVRARDISHAYELGKLKANHIKQEVVFSAIELGISALKDLGFSAFQAHRAAKIFTYHNQEVKRELHTIWQADEQHYISEVKRHARELEEILRNEAEQSIHESDDAWDYTSLREEIIELFGDKDLQKEDKGK